MQTLLNAMMTVFGWYIYTLGAVLTLGSMVGIPVMLVTRYEPDATMALFGGLAVVLSVVVYSTAMLVVAVIVELRKQ